LTGEPELLLGPLERRMRALAGVERFEEAALARDRLRVLARALARERTVDTVRQAARVLTDGPDGRIEIVHGHLVLEGSAPRFFTAAALEPFAPVHEPRPARDEIDELLVVARWLLSKRVAAKVRVDDVAGTLASALPALPDYEPPRDAVRLWR
jgi:DNA polymerase-3 subunit epsilon